MCVGLECKYYRSSFNCENLAEIIECESIKAGKPCQSGFSQKTQILRSCKNCKRSLEISNFERKTSRRQEFKKQKPETRSGNHEGQKKRQSEEGEAEPTLIGQSIHTTSHVSPSSFSSWTLDDRNRLAHPYSSPYREPTNPTPTGSASYVYGDYGQPIFSQSRRPGGNQYDYPQYSQQSDRPSATVHSITRGMENLGYTSPTTDSPASDRAPPSPPAPRRSYFRDWIGGSRTPSPSQLAFESEAWRIARTDEGEAGDAAPENQPRQRRHVSSSHSSRSRHAEEERGDRSRKKRR